MSASRASALKSVAMRGRAGLLAFGLASILMLGACTSKPAADPRTQAPIVRTALVEPSFESSRAFTGVVAARIESDLGFRVPGKLLERFVDTGQRVSRGQPLASLDPTDLRLAAQAQQQAVEAARALARQTAADEARYREMRARGLISASTHDQAKAAADAAAAQLRAVAAQAAVARNANSYATLLADADGVVMETRAEPGQVVGSGQVVIRIARAGPREAIVQLPETLRPALGSTGRATIFGHEGPSVAARLRQLSDVADPMTRTFEARFVLDVEGDTAPLGATVTIQLNDERAGTAAMLQIPIGALHDAGHGPGVWRVDEQPSRVTWRPITIVRLDDENAYVSGQIAAGDRIVSIGAHLLSEGEAVRLADAMGASRASPSP